MPRPEIDALRQAFPPVISGVQSGSIEEIDALLVETMAPMLLS